MSARSSVGTVLATLTRTEIAKFGADLAVEGVFETDRHRTITPGIGAPGIGATGIRTTGLTAARFVASGLVAATSIPAVVLSGPFGCRMLSDG